MVIAIQSIGSPGYETVTGVAAVAALALGRSN
jgi:hypothetical protein